MFLRAAESFFYLSVSHRHADQVGPMLSSMVIENTRRRSSFLTDRRVMIEKAAIATDNTIVLSTTENFTRRYLPKDQPESNAYSAAMLRMHRSSNVG